MFLAEKDMAAKLRAVKTFRSVLKVHLESTRYTDCRKIFSVGTKVCFLNLLVSVLVLRSLIATTKTPVRSTIKPSVTQNDSRTPTVLASSPKGLVPDVGKPLLSKPPSTWVDVRLVNKRGFYLIMFENGTIAGSWKRFLTTRYGLFRIQSHGTGIVKLKSLTTMKYIAIGNLGQIYSTANSSNEDTLLKHAQEENHFYSFSSYLYPTTQNHSNRIWLLAIGSKGRIRNASRVSPLHKSHQFQISNIRENSGKSDVKALVHLVEHRGK
ncbi:hypothetical protein pdam_00018185 [Pocillopora damicornis]|uniref:Fibroblast growth factor n=1 Tax=Pocillopora damicornis TaxID=46731 RepID=A0A3M6TUJ2_POCDA|nr:hypothetical protein pdam_00018185 [Pocillopora damicornis]